MFAYIKGNLEEKTSTYVVIEANGIGYKIFMSQTAIDELGVLDNQVKVYTHYHVREDDVSLYGFKTNEELKMFELLLSVSGIGAKSAIIMLSNITPSSFALAVITNDIEKLTKIPGVGPKSAQRIILELKDKLKTSEVISKSKNSKIINTVAENNNQEDAIQALQVLGYTRKDIERALDKIDKTDLLVEDIIKKGLQQLSK